MRLRLWIAALVVILSVVAILTACSPTPEPTVTPVPTLQWRDGKCSPKTVNNVVPDGATEFSAGYEIMVVKGQEQKIFELREVRTVYAIIDTSVNPAIYRTVEEPTEANCEKVVIMGTVRIYDRSTGQENWYASGAQFIDNTGVYLFDIIVLPNHQIWLKPYFVELRAA